MKWRKLMKQIDCPKYDDCSAALCPLACNLEDLIWYSGVEEICSRKDFQSLDWIQNQKAIVKAKAPADKYFTVPMLQAIKQARRGIEGINPDQPLEKAREVEKRWIAEKKSGRVIAEQNQKPSRVVANKKDNLILATSTSHQDRGGEK